MKTIDLQDIPPLRVANMTAQRRHEIREEKASRFNRVWWHEPEPVRDDGGTGCAVALVALVLFGYALAGIYLLLF